MKRIHEKEELILSKNIHINDQQRNRYEKDGGVRKDEKVHQQIDEEDDDSADMDIPSELASDSQNNTPSGYVHDTGSYYEQDDSKVRSVHVKLINSSSEDQIKQINRVSDQSMKNNSQI